MSTQFPTPDAARPQPVPAPPTEPASTDAAPSPTNAQPAPADAAPQPAASTDAAPSPTNAQPAAPVHPTAAQHATLPLDVAAPQQHPTVPLNVATAQHSPNTAQHERPAPPAAYPVAYPPPTYSAPPFRPDGNAFPSAPGAGLTPAPGGSSLPPGSVFGPAPAAPAAPAGPNPSAPDASRRRGWVPLVSVAAAAARVASAGTAGAVLLLDDNSSARPAALSDLGKPASNADTAPVANSSSQNPNWEAVTNAVAPAVVAIQVQMQGGEAEGSGVIIEADGHVVTNNHVVSGATAVQVTLSDGRLFKAKVVGTDPTTDLAVIELADAPKDLTVASLGDSNDVSVGESVLAVGNPLGLANTATTGIVSALNRPVSASGEEGGTNVVTNAIQIDAAVNPGNSGGPLFDAQGRVIGITSSIATMSSMGGQSGSIGLGFAIPVNLAKSISGQLIESGKAQHAFLGVTLTDATATSDGVTRRGAKVGDVTSGSPASKAGIKSGDVIVAIDSDPVTGAESLTGYVRARAAGDEAQITLVRDGKAQTVTVTLAAKQIDTSTPQGGSQGDQGGQGDQGDQGRRAPGQGGTDQGNPNNIPDPYEWFFGGQG